MGRLPRRPLDRLGWVAVVVCLVLATDGCGGSDSRATRPPKRPSSAATTSTASSSTGPVVHRPRPRLITILSAARRPGLFGRSTAVLVRGRAAAWISRVSAHNDAGHTITLVGLDQQLVTLALHAGGAEPGGSGWRYGAAIEGGERRIVIGAFNSAFRESYGAGGFAQDGRVGWPLRRGAASVVIYRDGSVDIGAWKHGVPQPGRAVAAVRQNLSLLIDRGHVPSSVDTCVKVCWGDPLHEQPVVARSGLGITPGGELVWAAGHDLSVRALAEALAATGVVRAIELDINPRWVAGYLYAHGHHSVTPAPISLVPGQTGIPGQFLQPYFRDFFTVIARSRS